MHAFLKRKKRKKEKGRILRVLHALLYEWGLWFGGNDN